MKYPGRALLLFILLGAALYGTEEVWPTSDYSSFSNPGTRMEVELP